MAIINLSKENLKNLEAIQNVILVEEAQQTTLNEALARVLSFYHKYVPLSVR